MTRPHTVALYQKVRPCMLGDFYPLFPHDESESQWYGYQFDNPDLNLGCTLLFRCEECAEAAKVIRLQKVDPKATYEVTDLDAGTTATRPGKERRKKGLTVEIQNKPGAAIILYKRIP